MLHTGIVVKLNGGKATVDVLPASTGQADSANCPHCAAAASGLRVLEAANVVNARAGDVVELEESGSGRFLGLVVLFVVPVVAGVVVGGAGGDVTAGLGLVAGLGLGVGISALLYRLLRRSPAMKARLIRVVRPGEDVRACCPSEASRRNNV
jgi:hypothetical protein